MLNTKFGFTLIELMIVVAIIAILASVVYPSYTEYTRRAHRGDGISSLQMILDAQERYYSDFRTYTTDLTKLGLPSSYTTPNGHYSIRAAKCGNQALSQCVQLTATPSTAQSKDGNLIADTRGRQDRIVGSSTLKW